MEQLLALDVKPGD
jgi:chromosome segregation ATPase